MIRQSIFTQAKPERNSILPGRAAVALLVPLLTSCVNSGQVTRQVQTHRWLNPTVLVQQKPLTPEQSFLAGNRSSGSSFLPPTSLVIEEQRRMVYKAPARFQQWVNAGHSGEVSRFEQFLANNRLQHVAPLNEILNTARDWEKCGRDPYALAPESQWQNLLPTLNVVKELRQRHILSSYEVTSVFRDAELNACAGGSLGSKHVQNAAVDFRLTGDQGTEAGMLQSKAALCQFWREHGAEHNLGLGVYASGQIHLDTKGYRTWGADYSSATSPCAIPVMEGSYQARQN